MSLKAKYWFKEIGKIFIGLILCHLITIITYFIETAYLHSIESKHIVYSIEFGGNLTNWPTFISAYLPIFLVLVFLALSTLFDYKKVRFQNIKWKVILFFMYLISFEYSLLSKFMNFLGQL